MRGRGKSFRKKTRWPLTGCNALALVPPLSLSCPSSSTAETSANQLIRGYSASKSQAVGSERGLTSRERENAGFQSQAVYHWSITWLRRSNFVFWGHKLLTRILQVLFLGFSSERKLGACWIIGDWTVYASCAQACMQQLQSPVGGPMCVRAL